MPCTLLAVNRYGGETRHYELAAGKTAEDRWPLDASAGWFDLSMTSPEDATFLRRFAGHVETSRLATSDPANFTAS